MKVTITTIFGFAIFITLCILPMLVKAETQISTNYLLNVSNVSNILKFNETKMNNSLSAENLTFTGNQNITRYVTLPQNITFPETQNKLNLSGHIYQIENDSAESYSITDGDLVNPTYWNDSDWNTNSYIIADTLEDINALVFQNYSYKEGIESLIIQYKYAQVRNFPHCNLNTFRIRFYNYTSNSWNTVFTSPTGEVAETTANISISVNEVKDYIPSDEPFMSEHFLRVVSADTTAGCVVIDYEEKIFYNLYLYNAYLDVSGDGDKNWEYSGSFNHTNNQTSDFSSELSSYLLSCSPDSNGNCDVPHIFHSDTVGKEGYSALNYTYNYNISQLFEKSITSWDSSRTIDIGTKYNTTMILNFTSYNASVNISLPGYYTYTNLTDATAERCGINETIGTPYQDNCTISMDVTKGSKFGNFTLWEEITPVKEEDKGCPTGFADYGTYCLESYLYANGDYRYNYTVYFNATTNLTKNNNINYTIPISNLPNFNSKNASWSYAINGTSANLTNLTDATNLYITIGNNFSSSSLYQGVWIFSVQYYIPSESVPPGGGGSDFIGPAITYVSGNWTFTKESAFLIMSANSTIETYFTIDNRENVNITNFEITCSSEHDLCNYVVFKEMIIMESIPLLQTFAIPPGKMADISYSITLPLDLDLKAFEIYDIVLMVKIGKIQRPFTVSIWYLPGGQVIAGGFSWFAGSTFGIPNWLILVFIVIVIIVIVLLAIKEINKPKWYKLIKR